MFKHPSSLIPIEQSSVPQQFDPWAHLSGVTFCSQHHHRGPRFLVVDDNAAIRGLLRALLEEQDSWEVCAEASNGSEAVAKFDETRFDVIVLDFQMPVMNGLDAAKRISLRSPTAPILMVTMHSSPQLVEQAKKAGIRGMCPKADIHCLVEGVATILDHRSYFKN